MSRFAKLATGLRDFGHDINANISKALNISKISADPHYILLSEAKAGRVNELEALILARPDPTFNVNLALDSSFMSPLCLACAGGHRDAATFLLQKANADPNNKAGAAAAAADASQGHPRDPNGDRLLCHGSMAGAGNYDSTPPAPLMLAVEAGLEDVVVDLLARGARVDARRAGDGWTALHLCAAQGHALIMRTLLSAPLADPGVRTTQLETPLTVACSKGHLAIADMLLGEGGDETTVGKKESEETGGQTALGKRTVRGTTSSDVGSAAKNSRGTRRHAEERTWAGRTPLHYAAAEGHTEVVLRLLAHGVSANLVDAQGATPLILAARRGHSATVAVLVVDGRATLNATTMEGDTALHAAAGTSADGASAAVRLLLRNGADVDARNAFGSTALHLAAASEAVSSVTALLANGANASATNSCGLTPGACFLRAPAPLSSGSVAPASSPASANQQARERIRRILRKNRRRHGHLQRLANASAKRADLAAVAAKTAEAVNRFAAFTKKAQKWDVDAKDHRQRLQRLDDFREEILSTQDSSIAGSAPSLESATDGSSLLELSPEREDAVTHTMKRRRKAAAEASKGTEGRLRDLRHWKSEVLAEREGVTAFLRRVDPALAFAPGPGCHSGSGGGGRQVGVNSGTRGIGGEGLSVQSFEADLVICDPRLAEVEDEAGDNRGHVGALTLERRSTSSGGHSPPESHVLLGNGRAGSTRDGTAPNDDLASSSVHFEYAQAALNACASALKEAIAAAGAGDRLSTALDTLREHIKATLFDLMDLETSLPGDPDEIDGVCNGDETSDLGAEGKGGIRGASSGASDRTIGLTPEEAGTLDAKVGGLVRRLSGDAQADEDGPPSLAILYGEGLGTAAAASEAEVDATESLTAHALRVVCEAAVGPLLSSLDDAYQRLTAAEAELKRYLPEAKALLGGKESEVERAREARSRLISVRQQVADEGDHLEELLSKLRRRRRQAAGDEEIAQIEDECRNVRARLATLRSVKLVELKDLRLSRAYQRFPELLLEHPDAAESAFRVLLLSDLAVRDVDEWDEPHMSAVASVGSGGGSGGGAGGGGKGESGNAYGFGGAQHGSVGRAEILNGWGGEGCRLAEVDGSTVAIVEVECRDRLAKRELVTALLLLTPPPRRKGHGATNPPHQPPPPELARITAISLREGRAMLEVPAEGWLSAKAWLTAATTTAAPDSVTERALVVFPPPSVEAPSPTSPKEDGGMAGTEVFQWEVWAVMLQALRGLVAVHAFSDGATHRAVCLENILVVSRPLGNAGSSCGQVLAPDDPRLMSSLYSTQQQPSPPLPRGLRQAQLGPPAPAALCRPPPQSLAPEVVRGKPFSQAADVYAFGIALRAACCGGSEVKGGKGYGGSAGIGGSEVGAGSGGVQAVLGPGFGPPPGPARQSLMQVLGGMLEEDPSKRWSALEALSSDYFRVPPPRSPNPVYPLKWSPFPGERSRRVSIPGPPGGHPNWVAAAISVGGILKGAGTMAGSGARGWWESCYLVDIPPPADEGERDIGTAASDREWADVESFLRHSIPAARLRRLVRLQDRGRWLRFACIRDRAVAACAAAGRNSAAGASMTTRGGAPVSCFFADPRDVATRDTLASFAAGGKAGVRNGLGSPPTEAQGEASADRTGGNGGASGAAAEQIRCSASARFAAVALAPPQPPVRSSLMQGSPETAGPEVATYNLRTLAVVRAVTGMVSEERSLDVGGTRLAPPGAVPLFENCPIGAQAMTSAATSGFSAGGQDKDPFWGVESSVDDLTRADRTGLSSSLSAYVGGDEEVIEKDAGLLPRPAAGLGQPSVDSIKTWESLTRLGMEEGVEYDADKEGGLGFPAKGGDATRGNGGEVAAVYTVRRDACYPEYLATFSFAPQTTERW